MEPLTKRQVIEFARDGLIKQGGWSKVASSCLYISDSDKRCAIGILPGFPEELGDAIGTASDLYLGEPRFRAMFDKEVDIDFLDKVQEELHDSPSHGDFNPNVIVQAANELLNIYCRDEVSNA